MSSLLYKHRNSWYRRTELRRSSSSQQGSRASKHCTSYFSFPGEPIRITHTITTVKQTAYQNFPAQFAEASKIRIKIFTCGRPPQSLSLPPFATSPITHAVHIQIGQHRIKIGKKNRSKYPQFLDPQFYQSHTDRTLNYRFTLIIMHFSRSRFRSCTRTRLSQV